MANINKNELTKEQIEKAMACETAEELMALAKAEGVELTKDEAEGAGRLRAGRGATETGGGRYAPRNNPDLQERFSGMRRAVRPPGIMPGKTACGDKGKSKW